MARQLPSSDPLALRARALLARELAGRIADPAVASGLVRLEHALLGVAWLKALSDGEHIADR
jgi:hypothetical protein